MGDSINQLSIDGVERKKTSIAKWKKCPIAYIIIYNWIHNIFYHQRVAYVSDKHICSIKNIYIF